MSNIQKTIKMSFVIEFYLVEDNKMVMSSVDSVLIKAKKLVKSGEQELAIELIRSFLQSFPKNKRAQKALINLVSQEHQKIQNPPADKIKSLTKLYDEKNFELLIEQTESLLIRFSNSWLIWNFLGAAKQALKDYPGATIAFKKVTQLNPKYADGHNNLGVSLRHERKYKASLSCFEKAISLKPNFAEAFQNMGDTLNAVGSLTEALEAFNKAVVLKNDLADGYNGRGTTLHLLAKYDEAEQSFKQAIDINPSFAVAYANLGLLIWTQGNVEKAVTYFKKALSLEPRNSEAKMALSIAFLNSGKFEEGLALNEARWQSKIGSTGARHFSKPMWDGIEGLENKVILLWSEQGPGDVVMWLSSLEYLIPLAKSCIIECPEKLLILLRRSFPDVDVRLENKDPTSEPSDFDFHLPIGSLFKNFLKQISERTSVASYLVPNHIRVEFWKKRLNSLGHGPYIGISWKSPLITPERSRNYTTVSDWRPVLQNIDATFINLQCKDFQDDLYEFKKRFGVVVHNFDDLDQYNNLDDVAALSAALDMCISVSTAVSTITAAVGLPTKMLHWRQSAWNNMLNTTIGPSVKVFERNTWETWEKPMKLIATDIQKVNL